MSSLRTLIVTALLLLGAALAAFAQQAPVYLWFEPEWFPDVEGSFGYWSGPGASKPTGHWGVAGPGISAEFTQGGESEWNSIGAPAEETNAVCSRDFTVPRDGAYRVWVRYYDHWRQAAPFTVRVEQNGQAKVAAELGAKPLLPPNDEYMLYWGFAFGWGSADARLAAGPAKVSLVIDKAGETWRQADAILITDDLTYTPVMREKPHFAYMDAIALQPENGAAWRGSGKGLTVGAAWKRPAVAGRDFSMWTGIGVDADWWKKQDLAALTKYDLFFQFSPPADIKDKFQQQFAGRKDLPIMSWSGLIPGFYLGNLPDFSPESPIRKWLEATKTPFYILTNYATANFNAQVGPANFQALTGPLAGQFLGFIHGEAMASCGTEYVGKPLGTDRAGHLEAMGPFLKKAQAVDWSKKFVTPVPESFWSKGIACLSCESIALAPMYHETGAAIVGYELDATNSHTPMRIAFERGAARQYGGSWLNYASSNFGDACNYFSQNPVVPRGAPSWFHSKYAVTDGVDIAWYRKFYYLNYLGGAAAIFWEQGLGNQWMLPGPGTHPVQLSPFGRATIDFQAFVDRLPDRGEPYTPVAFLLGYAHGYEPVNYACKAFNFFPENAADRELRELFNVAWHPAEVSASRPINPELQSLPAGTYGNIFDVLIDKPERAQALASYPVVWAAGDVELGGRMLAALRDYVRKGGTLVVNVNAAKGALPEDFLGVRLTNATRRCESWTPDGKAAQACPPYLLAGATLDGAKALATDGQAPLITRNAVGDGAVILTLVPGMQGLDERAHPALPYLMNGLTSRLLPVQVLLPDGKRPVDEIMYQVNRTKTGWLVMLLNNRGVDKTQNGVARVDRTAVADLVLRTSLNVRAAKEYTDPRDLAVERNAAGTEIRIRVQPGDLQVVELVAQ